MAKDTAWPDSDDDDVLDAATVLTAIGRHHPDKRIAKIARKSAYKAASRHAARQ
jgi:hypothetical protein